MREHCVVERIWLVSHAGECDMLGVGKMSKDVGMVIRKSIAV